MDYGNESLVSKSNLRFLKSSFVSFPVDCHAARLGDVVPLDSASTWTEEQGEKTQGRLHGHESQILAKPAFDKASDGRTDRDTQADRQTDRQIDR